jgi:hypothetical protein
MSNYKCRECGEALYKCECEPEVTEELRAHHFNTSGIYSSDADIAVWSKSISAKLPDENLQSTQQKPQHKAINIGTSDYAQHKIQPWDIWREYSLNPWDADIIKRVLRTKIDNTRKLDYEKIIHICQERIAQLDGVYEN